MAKQSKNVVAKNKVMKLAGSGSGAKLGYVVWWAVEHNIKLAADAVKKAFSAAGVSDSPVAFEQEAAFTRAFRKAGVMKEFSGWLMRKIYIGEDRIVYGVVKETIEQKKEELDYEKEDKVWMVRKTGEIKMEKGIAQAKRIKEIYADINGTVDNRCITKYLAHKMPALNTLPLREAGGVYFLPIYQEDAIFKLEKALTACSKDTMIFLMPIYEDTRSKAGLQYSFDESFEAQLKEMAEDIEEHLANEKTTRAYWNNRLDEYKAVRERAKMYEDLLQFKAEKVHKVVGGMEEKVKKALAKVLEA